MHGKRLGLSGLYRGARHPFKRSKVARFSEASFTLGALLPPSQPSATGLHRREGLPGIREPAGCQVAIRKHAHAVCCHAHSRASGSRCS